MNAKQRRKEKRRTPIRDESIFRLPVGLTDSEFIVAQNKWRQGISIFGGDRVVLFFFDCDAPHQYRKAVWPKAKAMMHMLELTQDCGSRANMYRQIRYGLTEESRSPVEDGLVFWYRYSDPPYMNKPRLEEYAVLRETTAGVWLAAINRKNGQRFVLKNAFRRFAYQSKEDAWKHFVARKKKQMFYLQGNLDRLNKTLQWIRENSMENVEDGSYVMSATAQTDPDSLLPF